ncbi:MAG: NUDIX domain-containing protein [Hyphomonadaceae bacterium]|nr:NUDIX domain-containing protein [Hyphomonadaceae bacterium]
MTQWRTRLEPVITPAFRTWWRLRRAMTLGVRGIVTDREGAVLLVRHTYTKGWHLPGGGVERGESAVAALKRELEEEGGVSPLGAPLLLGCYANHSFPNDHILAYRVIEWRPVNAESGHEIAERGFFALDALPIETTRGTRRRLAEAFGGTPISTHW